ncbi:EF-P lysine aminoacylase EpmA [Bermanella sp. R86510]|uniref:EF-P lysine aminoacylase EpmA n=1 Tax=unclassified Bermanella TaxID=2627862 RepID=UPI0037C6976E
MQWQPSTSIQGLKQRAHLNAYVRAFFEQRQVLEVETPLLSKAAVSDASLQPIASNAMGAPCFLHTSPEYPMKRLLAAGSGDIYQICKTFRDQEQGNRHNPEFSMLEYYRLGFNLGMLMDEVAQLIGDYLHIQQRSDFSYSQAMQRFANIHPFTISDSELRTCVDQFVGNELTLSRDECLDVVMSHVVEPKLPHNELVFIHSYPASQAALANTYESAHGYEVAQRFELYVNGLELANGYDELVDSTEQAKRFELEAGKRQQVGLPQAQYDEHFLQALQAGLPQCAGVAIGLDRILMLKMKVSSIRDVLSFDFERA